MYRLHRDELDAIEDEEVRHRRLVELNVAEQCLNLYKTGVVQKRRLETHRDPDIPYAYPRIHGLVFDPASGKIKKIDVDYRDTLHDNAHIYDLFEIDGKL